MPQQDAPPRKRIGVFFDDPGYGDYPFNHDEYVQAYHEVAHAIDDRGACFFLVRDASTFLGGNRFRGYWKFDGSTFVRHDDNIDLELVYDKSYKNVFTGDERTWFLNSRELDHICVDKRETARMFPDYSPKTSVVHSRGELETAMASWTSAMAVAKPIDGAEAKGVVIGPPVHILAVEHVFPLLLQEYVDASGGIPGIIEGVGDLRTIMIDGEVALTYARRAKTGSLISNVSKGGVEIEVLPDRRPSDVIAIAKDVDSRFKPLSKHRVFCVDCARDASGRWYIIELNSKPGLSVRNHGITYPRYQDLLVDALVSAASPTHP